MPSFTTIFRAVVMLAAAVIVVKGWQLYGPSAEQIKALTGRAAEIAQSAWNELQQPTSSSQSLTVDQQEMAPAFAAPPPIASEGGVATPAVPGVLAADTNPVAPPVFGEPNAAGGGAFGELSRADALARSEIHPLQVAGASAPDRMASEPGADDDRLPNLLARLESLGGMDPQLAKWGTSGQLYRFCCRAAWGDSPKFSRHFESVASEPLVAVEEVVSKVEAWRASQRDRGELR